MALNTMVYLAVDTDGMETMFTDEPRKGGWIWHNDRCEHIELPPGTIKKLTGKTLTWDDGYVTYVSDDYEPAVE
jgi:hypothetical protein